MTSGYYAEEMQSFLKTRDVVNAFYPALNSPPQVEEAAHVSIRANQSLALEPKSRETKLSLETDIWITSVAATTITNT